MKKNSSAGSGGGEGVFEAGALRGEHLAAVFGDVPVVFEADAELAGDVDAGFVGEAHAWGEWGGVAADEVGPLVAVHADAVAEAAGGGFEVGAVPGGVGPAWVGGALPPALDPCAGCRQSALFLPLDICQPSVSLS